MKTPLWQYDLTTEIRRDIYRRGIAHTRKRLIAWLCVTLAAVVMAVAFGCLIDLVCSPLFSAFATCSIIAGIWAAYYLLK